MTEKKHIAADASALAALPPMAMERLAAEVHARGCPECCRELRRAERVLELLDAQLEPPGPPRQSLRRTMDRTRSALALRIVAWPLGAVLALATLVALGGAYPDEGLLRWAGAAALAMAGAVLSWLAIRSRPVLATVGAAALLSAVFAVSFAGAGPVEPLLGLRCTLVELIPIASGIMAILVLRRGLALRDRTRALALVAASGLCAQAALVVSCPARLSAVHVLLFHSGGLLAICAAAAWIVPRLARRSLAQGPGHL